MDAWLTSHQPWLRRPWGYGLLAAVAFVPLIFVAIRRRMGFDTYWRVPLHILASSSPVNTGLLFPNSAGVNFPTS